MPYTLSQLMEGEHSQSIKALICRLDLGISDLQVERLPQPAPSIPDGLPDEKRQALLTLLGGG
jgi:hypothetical protein